MRPAVRAPAHMPPARRPPAHMLPAHMLKEFLAWWGAQLAGLLPPVLRARRIGSGNAIVADLAVAGGQPAIELLARRNRREASLGRFAGTGAAATDALRQALSRRNDVGGAVLRVPASFVLDRQITLPVAAERDLDRVLQYEMDRLTPFSADEVFSAYHVEARDRARNRLSVRLRVVPRMTVAPYLAMLAQAGLRAASIEMQGETSPGRAIPLSREVAGGAVWRRRGAWALATACVLLAVAAAALPFVRQQHQLHSVEGFIAALRPRVDEAETLRRRIAAAASGVDVIAAQRARVGDALATLAAVTDILPDDTSLTELTLSQRKLGVQGQSAAAARLIAALAADPAIRNPSFAAPVIRNDAGRADIFSIQAEMLP